MSSAELPAPLNHPALGQVQGKYGKGVIQYLGLKYGSLTNRFSEAKLVEYDGTSKINATRHGPPATTFPGALEMETTFIGAELPKFDPPPISDTESLNLNITVPPEPGHDLPVLVYIHGGGFAFGSNSYPHYDQSKVVDLSVVMGQPLIAININYRLNVAGFLDSTELRVAGFKANRGLRDQRLALQWIKKYISGFGGSPDRITVAGQSAGAASVTFQLHSEEPLFNQAILLGGSFFMMPPSTQDTAERLYQAVIKDLKLSVHTPEGRVQALQSLSPDAVVPEITPALASLGPVVDGDLVPVAATFSDIGDDAKFPLPGRGWCERILAVDSEIDGSIFGLVDFSARESTLVCDFTSAVNDAVGESGKLVLEAYKISEESMGKQAVDSAVRFVTDVAFYAAGIKLAEAWPGKSYVGHFNEGNPFAAPYAGHASHLLDIAYLWGNYNQTYPRRCWAVARAFAEDVVSFTTGHDQLPEFKASEQLVRVYGPSEKDLVGRVLKVDDEGTERDRGVFELADKVGGLDKLLDVVKKLLGPL
ncbi:hypothetical protein FALCPG4_008660 [Fusarium falciforme]